MMNVRFRRRGIALSAVACLGAWSMSGRALAQETTPPVTVAPAPPPRAEAEVTKTSRPNVPLLTTGLATVALSYPPALIVAARSEHKGDDFLYIPVAGPWLDLANRGCDAGERVNCGTTGAERAGLITLGVAHAIGVIAIGTSFIFPQRRTVVKVTASREPRFHVAPAYVGPRAYGIAAAGSF
jgi:hypothetical protein